VFVPESFGKLGIDFFQNVVQVSENQYFGFGIVIMPVEKDIGSDVNLDDTFFIDTNLREFQKADDTFFVKSGDYICKCFFDLRFVEVKFISARNTLFVLGF
jgi:hypothetical protein